MRNGPHKLFVLLTCLFNAMLVHRCCPDNMLKGKMVPIPKCKRAGMSSSVTLGSVICKLFDYIILNKEQERMSSNDLQFGFKRNVSTMHSVFVLSEVIFYYYNYNPTNVYAVFLDATKAFNRVQYSKLFRILIDEMVTPIVLRLLLYMYAKQTPQVKWGEHISEEFNVSNGVKQGGVLSPVLFSLYIDELFDRLVNSQWGCHVGNYFMGCVAYADDIAIMAPSLHGLKAMIEICEEYAVEYNIKFNGQKSQFMTFTGRDCRKATGNITICGDAIQDTDEVIYLGVKLSNKDRYKMVVPEVSQFWKSFNMLRADFGAIDTTIQCLLKQYGCTFYGAPLWRNNGASLRHVCVAWRKALMRVWRLSPRTHCNTIYLLSACEPMEVIIQRRFINFANSIHNNEVLSTMLLRIILFLREVTPITYWSGLGLGLGSDCGAVVRLGFRYRVLGCRKRT